MFTATKHTKHSREEEGLGNRSTGLSSAYELLVLQGVLACFIVSSQIN